MPASLASQAGKILRVKSTNDGYELVTDVRTFKDSTDVTAYVAGDANKFVVVNSTGTGIAYRTVDFKTTTLTDMPSSLAS
jgi:hypothetical protein